MHDNKYIECLRKHFFFDNWHIRKRTINGIGYEELPDFKSFFCVNIEVYSWEEDEFVRSIYKLRGTKENTISIYIYESYILLIPYVKVFAKKHICQTCYRHFDHTGHHHCHRRICTNNTKFVITGEFYNMKDNIIELLDQFDIEVPQEDHIFK